MPAIPVTGNWASAFSSAVRPRTAVAPNGFTASPKSFASVRVRAMPTVPSKELMMYQVSTLVNSGRVDGPRAFSLFGRRAKTCSFLASRRRKYFHRRHDGAVHSLVSPRRTSPSPALERHRPPRPLFRHHKTPRFRTGCLVWDGPESACQLFRGSSSKFQEVGAIGLRPGNEVPDIYERALGKGSSCG